MDSSSNLILTALQQTRGAAHQLAMASGSTRRRVIMLLAQMLETSFDQVLEANTLDLEISREMAVSELVVEWLKLTPERLEATVGLLKQLTQSADPTKKLIKATYQLEPCQTYSQLRPLGTIALVYEAFPELALIAAGMCIATGNGLILRGSSTAANSNQATTNIIHHALAELDLPPDCINNISPDGESSIQELVTQDRYLDLIIPYGRPSLVRKVTEQATAPVLRTAIGNCYLYWSSTADLELVRQMIIDSHRGEPDAVNAIEKVLVHKNVKSSLLTSLFSSLQEQNFQLRGEAQLVEDFPEYLQPMKSAEWRQFYLKRVVAFKYIDTLPNAISWINRYSSGHANCLATESYEESRKFAQNIDGALIYVNTSPRFCRNPNCGEGVFLGMSNQKGYRQGLIGLETFTTVKQIVQG
ncbi:gamma-glutamyl phosphate reductase [Xenococcus sp. PCC 7305]|uniref:glutamate-5-semialdehyde dehydrogenase n=1 Tax=Xenococcus sp. PCC 7305 TaxID=102125 RepID=UPI0002ABC84B|nr:glutamate-5-semialdehyde dehydrogenase [Xenococcus sp. PCC 7305]ELS01283.1 gamma-glutamyl phosphate reductase [Xenococcus sp. PCC 7305]